MSFVGTTVVANEVYVDAYDAVSHFVLTLDGATFTSATRVYGGSDVADIDVLDSTLTAVTYIEVDSDSGGVSQGFEGSTLDAGTYVYVYGDYGSVLFEES